MAFNSVTRDRDWMLKLRQWELVIVTAASALVLDKKITSTYFILSLIIVVLAFWFLESRLFWSIRETGKKSSEQERLLEERNPDRYCENIINWKFGTGPSLIDQTLFEKIYDTVKCGIRPSQILWHVVFIAWIGFLILFQLSI
jgi:hypothetical protein